VKLKKIVSVCFILLVLLSSIGYYESEPLKIASGQPYAEAQLSVESDEEFQEFRHTIKISVSSPTATRSFDSFYSASLLVFTTVHNAIYCGYLQRHISSATLGRLFIQLGALIV
jgi:hypothetical protein